MSSTEFKFFRRLLSLFIVVATGCTSPSDKQLIEMMKPLKASGTKLLSGDVLETVLKKWSAWSCDENDDTTLQPIRLSGWGSKLLYYSLPTGNTVEMNSPAYVGHHSLKIIGAIENNDGMWVQIKDANIYFFRLNRIGQSWKVTKMIIWGAQQHK